MHPTTDTFTVTFSGDRDPSVSHIGVHLGKVIIPVLCNRRVEDLIRDFVSALDHLSEVEKSSALVPLRPDGICDARIEKDGDAGYFLVISRQQHLLAPKDRKERYLVAERMEYAKIQRRIRKGIERYLADPETKRRANQPLQGTPAKASSSSTEPEGRRS